MQPHAFLMKATVLADLDCCRAMPSANGEPMLLATHLGSPLKPSASSMACRRKFRWSLCADMRKGVPVLQFRQVRDGRSTPATPVSIARK